MLEFSLFYCFLSVVLVIFLQVQVFCYLRCGIDKNLIFCSLSCVFDCLRHLPFCWRSALSIQRGTNLLWEFHHNQNWVRMFKFLSYFSYTLPDDQTKRSIRSLADLLHFTGSYSNKCIYIIGRRSIWGTVLKYLGQTS